MSILFTNRNRTTACVTCAVAVWNGRLTSTAFRSTLTRCHVSVYLGKVCTEQTVTKLNFSLSDLDNINPLVEGSEYNNVHLKNQLILNLSSLFSSGRDCLHLD